MQNKAGDVRFWPLATSFLALHMSAIGCKADMTICGVSAFAVAIGGKADMTVCEKSAFAVAIGGKADMTCCAAYVRF